MRTARTVNNFGRKNIAVFAALAISSLVAPVAATLRVQPVEVAPVATAAKAEGACLRKVRVVYGGYGQPADGCAAH